MASPEPETVALLNCLPRPAVLLSRDYRILAANERYRAVYGSIGQPKRRFCYEVSHHNTVPCHMAGEACPLKQTLETGENAQVLHIHHTPRGQEYVNVEIWPVKDPISGEVEFFIEQMYPSDAASTTPTLDRMVGKSPSFQAMMGLVERVARSDSTVMQFGESGTGKEMVAQTLHRLSARAEKPFVPVECTGLPDQLFESELFGYVKGAFTGAMADKTGLVAAADGGTLFLDEVCDIPLSNQVKLLRLMDTRRFRRVGSTEWQAADFRLVCATNKDLRRMVDEGTFREDLYYRLNVFEIELPPLRERVEDLEPLIATMLERLNAPNVEFADDAMQCLRDYPFPGNVRELRNIVERAVLLADHDVVRATHLPRQCQQAAASDTDGNDIVPLEEAERRYLRRVLSLHQGPRKALAEKLAISERVLYRKLAELRLET